MGGNVATWCREEMGTPFLRTFLPEPRREVMRSRVLGAGGRVSLALAMIFFACMILGPVRNVQAQDKPQMIQIGVIGDFSGPYAPIVGQTRPGTEDAWQYINEELGGVRGVKGKPIIRDMTGKVDLGLSMYNEVINMKPKPPFVDIYITPLSEALRTRYVEDDVVGFHAGAIVSLYPQANGYGLYALYPEMIGAVVKWTKDAWKEKRPMKIGLITWDTSYGKAFLTKEFFDYMKRIGVEVLGEPQLFGIREVEITAQLLKLKALNPDYLVTNTTAGGALAIQKGLKEMGWNVPVLNTAGLDWGTGRLDPVAFEGCVVSMPTISFDETEDQTVKTIMKYFKQNNRTVNDISLFYFLGWQSALIEHKILTDVVDQHGWQGVNTKNVKAALNGLKDFKALGGISIITYTEKRRTPTKVRMYKYMQGKFLPQSDWLEVEDMRPPEFR
jgi:branched-chain amino acid transport system substrate-binding protein